MFMLDATRITLAPSFLGVVCDYTLNTLLPMVNATTAQLLAHMAAAPPAPLSTGALVPKLPLSNSAYAPAPPPPMPMTAKMQLQGVEAALVERETELTSQALVSALALTLEARISDQNRHVSMNVTEVRMFKCRANMPERTGATILNPLSITLLLEQQQAPKDNSTAASTRIDAKMSPIEMVASYHDLRLLMRLSTQWLAVLQQIKPKGAAAATPAAQPAWAEPMTPLAPRDRSVPPPAALGSVGISQEEDSGASKSPSAPTPLPSQRGRGGARPPMESLTLSFPRLELTLINDCLTADTGSSNTTDTVVPTTATGSSGALKKPLAGHTFSMPLLYVFMVPCSSSLVVLLFCFFSLAL